MIRLWLAGLLRRLAAVSVGVAVAAALLAALGGFLVSAQATMTDRASRSVAVDWQVQVGYSATFPGEIRPLTGTGKGVLVAQQTAANLHVSPGDQLQVLPGPGQAPAPLTVAGIVDLPQANSLFQRVGAAPQAQPAAPPDNVILIPQATFDARLAGPAANRITQQIHVVRDHALPAEPAAAYTAETGAARNLEVALAGAGTVGDNLGAALGAAAPTPRTPESCSCSSAPPAPPAPSSPAW